MDALKSKIQNKQAKIGIIGLGYIGLSLSEAFGKKGFSIYGYDIDKKKIEGLKKKENPLPFLPLPHLFQYLDNGLFHPTYIPEEIKDCDIYIISVPTPLNKEHLPDLSCVKSAANQVAKFCRNNQLIILQSTTYPGTTEEILLPLLELGRFKVGQDIFLAYVPEREDAGDPNFDFTKVPRLIGGMTKECQEVTALLYEQITDKVHLCSSPKIAEAAKVFENAYRLINIAFVDEMKEAFDHLGIDIMEVIAASATKPFGFTKFVPGPGIGGECIPVDPVYLAHKIKAQDGPTSLIETAEIVNARAPYFVIQKVIDALNMRKKCLNGAHILAIGAAFKKDVSDIRESPAIKVISLLKEKGAEIFYHDPLVPFLHALNLRSISLTEEALKGTDCVVILTDHSNIDWEWIIDRSSLVVDTRQVSYGSKYEKQKVVHA